MNKAQKQLYAYLKGSAQSDNIKESLYKRLLKHFIAMVCFVIFHVIFRLILNIHANKKNIKFFIKIDNKKIKCTRQQYVEDKIWEVQRAFLSALIVKNETESTIEKD